MSSIDLIKASNLSSDMGDVVVHPLVLLSVVDHFNRVAKGANKRVVGVLLGTREGDTADITNSFAVPFEENKDKPTVWFLDHNFLDTMYWMFKKVNTRQNILGFYSTGPRIKENDLKIASLFRQFCASEPVFVIIDVRADMEGQPVVAYLAKDEMETEGKEISKVFKHIPSRIEATEEEGVGVEHLLRDINDPSTSTLAASIRGKIKGLAGLSNRLAEITAYMDLVKAGTIPVNNQIIYNLQDVFNLLPNLNVEGLIKSLLTKTNDMHHSIYISSLVRSVIALHNLLNNLLKFSDVDDVLDRKAGVDVAQPSKLVKTEAKENETKE